MADDFTAGKARCLAEIARCEREWYTDDQETGLGTILGWLDWHAELYFLEGEMEQFATGATRNVDTHKYDYEGFLSPWALERFGMYMQEHRRQKDGSLRESDNWQKGIPLSRYMKSLLRHVFAVWQIQRGMHPMDPDSGQVANLEDSLCGVFFNAQGMLHEIVKTKCLKSSS